LTMSSIINDSQVEESFELMIECMLQYKHRLIELGSKKDLTSMQAMTILMLDEPRPMNNLTKIFNCDASNVTGLVDGIEQKNLAIRFPAVKDRRMKMVELTKEGKAVRQKLIASMIDSHGSNVLAKLTTSELDSLVSILKKLVDVG
jgi:DNA-binding MarR family transcriptional regulator